MLLLLWDVDHTLIENGGVSKDTYVLAFRKLTGEAPIVRPDTDGRTDREIMHNLFASNEKSRQPSDADVETALSAAGHGLADELDARGHVLPGVLEVLAQVAEIPTIVQSALTGNLRPNAENKLRLLGDSARLLDLDIGGYGSDHVVRSELVPIAQRRAAVKHGVEFDRDSTVLVGDTPRDVEAAHNGGAKIIAVATGSATEGELRSQGADAVLPSLRDTQTFLDTIASLAGAALHSA